MDVLTNQMKKKKCKKGNARQKKQKKKKKKNSGQFLKFACYKRRKENGIYMFI